MWHKACIEPAGFQLLKCGLTGWLQSRGRLRGNHVEGRKASERPRSDRLLQRPKACDSWLFPFQARHIEVPSVWQTEYSGFAIALRHDSETISRVCHRALSLERPDGMV